MINGTTESITLAESMGTLISVIIAISILVFIVMAVRSMFQMMGYGNDSHDNLYDDDEDDEDERTQTVNIQKTCKKSRHLGRMIRRREL